jgi:competence protein ComEC
MRPLWKYRYLCVLAVAIALTAAAGLVFHYERNDGALEIYFLDVGQGDAIYARTPSGKDILIDGGPSKVLLRRLSEAMPWYDRTIDVVIASHPDADHIGGFPDLLNRYKVKSYFHSDVESDNSIDDEIRKILGEKRIPSKILTRGQRLDFRDGTHFDVLYPEAGAKASDTNALSIVGTLSYGSSTVLLTGDAPSSVERRIIFLDPMSVRAHILKVGHHGSKTSSDEDLIRHIAPRYAVISSGAGNRYRHPSEEVLLRFEEQGVTVLRTDRIGTVRMILRKDSVSLDN